MNNYFVPGTVLSAVDTKSIKTLSLAGEMDGSGLKSLRLFLNRTNFKLPDNLLY